MPQEDAAAGTPPAISAHTLRGWSDRGKNAFYRPPCAPLTDAAGRDRGRPVRARRQHGAALGEQIRHLRHRLIDDIVFGKGRAMGTAFLGVLYGILARMHPNIPRELREEMRGVADGARVPYRDVLLLNCFDDVLHTLIQLNPVLAPLLQHRFVKPVLGWLGSPPTPTTGLACSAFALTGDASATGAPIHGRNLDYLVQRWLRRSERARPRGAAEEHRRLRRPADPRAAVRLGRLARLRRPGHGAERRWPLAGLPHLDGPP